MIDMENVFSTLFAALFTCFRIIITVLYEAVIFCSPARLMFWIFFKKKHERYEQNFFGNLLLHALDIASWSALIALLYYVFNKIWH